MVRGGCRGVQAGAALVAVALAALVVALPVALAWGNASRPGARVRVPDLTVLLAGALARVRASDRPTFAHALLLEADGRTRRAGVGTRTAQGIVRWRFVFDNQLSRSRFATATILYGPPPRRFSRVRGYREPFLEDVLIRRLPRMTLAQAVARLRRAGYRQPFFDVTLRNPLGPRVSHPLYIFGLARRFIAVDTVSGRVTLLR
jgi:hypothetical protein